MQPLLKLEALHFEETRREPSNRPMIWRTSIEYINTLRMTHYINSSSDPIVYEGGFI